MLDRWLPAALASASAFALLVASAPEVHALPPPQAPQSRPTAAATSAPSGAVLPYGSELFFVLDDPVSSAKTAAGTTIRMHLKSPLVLNGTTLAPADAPATLSVITTQRAQTGDVDGAVQVHLNPFELPGRGTLPIRAFHEYLTIELTAGQESTRETTDTIADIFIPGHVIYHAFRKGHEMVLPVGTVLRAETGAAVDASNPSAIVISTPPPFVPSNDPVHSDLTPVPLFTAAPPPPRPTAKPRPTPVPTPPPAPTPGLPAPTGSPTPST